jgi:LTXXQ motif family protein
MLNRTVRSLGLGVFTLSVLSATAVMAQQRHGGAPAPHVSAPAPHVSAPAPHVSAPAPHVSAPAPHVSAPTPHFSAPAAHFNAPRPSAPHIGAAPHFAPQQRFTRPPVTRAPHVASPRFAAPPSGSARSSARPTFRGHVARTQQPGRQAQAPRGTSGSAIGNARNAERNIGSNAVPNRNARDLTNERNRNVTARAVRNALAARPIRDALRSPAQLRNPRTRSMVTAAAATAGWRDRREGRHEWWRHRHGGFGWVGPLFWPFAYYDVYDYALWGGGYDDAFWDYGPDDIYAALFTPYGYDELAGYLPSETAGVAYASREVRGRRPESVTRSSELSTMCGDDTRNIAGLPIDRIQQAVHPDDQQQAALDDLANASAKAAQVIKAACPTDVALTAPGRLEAMQRRVEAMIQAVEIVQPPLDRFYSLLSDEQNARLTALGEEQEHNRSAAENNANGSLGAVCGQQQTDLTNNWPTDKIVRAVRPDERQRAMLGQLKDAATQASEAVQASCPAEPPLTPPARLAAVHKRLDAMVGAIKTVAGPLNKFYASLSDEQKAQFDAIGPRRTAAG